MGPKGKPNTPKGKNPEKTVPEIDPDEVVTELQKEFFEFQLADIEKKINRIETREEELKSGTLDLEEMIEEYKKDKGAVIDEHEQLLAMKEEEKVRKREEMYQLSEEIKIRIEQHKKHIEELNEKFNKMVAELTQEIEQLEEEVRILEDYKQNKDVYTGKLDELERQMEEAEMQHQRNLFAVEKKWEMAISRCKKELQSRLLQLSIEFRQTSQKKIGKPCHRATQENKAIQNALEQMREEILEYQEKTTKLKNVTVLYKNLKEKKEQEKDKTIARTVIQVHVIKTLMKDRAKLLEKLKTFHAIDIENRVLVKRYKVLSTEVEKKTQSIEEITQNIETQSEETKAMKEANRTLKKNLMKLQVLIRNALKIAEEAMSVRLIPLGGMEEERFITNEAKIRLFKKRRDVAFNRKGKILQYLFDFLSKGQLTEDERKLLRSTSENIYSGISFSAVFGKTIVSDKEPDVKEGEEEVEEERKGPVFLTSLTSLPRSLSAVKIVPTRGESESFEGEFEKFEEEEESEMEEREEGGEEEEEEGEEEENKTEEKESAEEQENEIEPEKKSTASVNT